MTKKLIYIFIFSFLVLNTVWGQRKPKSENYSKYDRRWVHFGFMLGVNTADFSTQYKPNLLNDYNVYSITNKSQPGFQLGLISTVKLGTPLIRLRFVPSISFQERILNYEFWTEKGGDIIKDTHEERIGSTNLDFPLLLKFRTLRYNNFAVFVLGGAQYTLDLQSKEQSSQKFSDPFIKIFRDDFQGQVGAGVDFFLPFFKFSIELKLSHGFKDALIHDDTRLSRPIDKLYNRVWWFSITFEG